MAAMTPEQTLQRARAALAMPTLYWLGFGGYWDDDAAPATPGKPIDVSEKLAEMQREEPRKAQQYLAGLAQTGLSLEQLPRVACDCSGFVTWAMGIARHPSAIDWVNTTSMHADATGAQTMFVRLESPRVGALLVFPWADSGRVGHVGVISELDSDGRATRVIHCTPENFLIEPGNGAPRNAIAQTDAARFEQEPATIVAVLRQPG